MDEKILADATKISTNRYLDGLEKVPLYSRVAVAVEGKLVPLGITAMPLTCPQLSGNVPVPNGEQTACMGIISPTLVSVDLPQHPYYTVGCQSSDCGTIAPNAVDSTCPG